jgi:hypothetical protein
MTRGGLHGGRVGLAISLIEFRLTFDLLVVLVCDFLWVYCGCGWLLGLCFCCGLCCGWVLGLWVCPKLWVVAFCSIFDRFALIVVGSNAWQYRWR